MCIYSSTQFFIQVKKMGIFWAVLSGILTARIIEWLLVAAVKTYLPKITAPQNKIPQ